MRSIRSWLALVAFLGMSCGKEEAPPEPVIRPVRTLEVFATGGIRKRAFSGTSQAALESRLSFKVGGTISRVAVKVGDRVRAGQAIAELDPRDFELLVQDAEAGLKSTEAQARNAAANYSRVRALYENRNASRNELDAARAGSESAQAQVKSVQKKLELARLQRSYARLTSPVNGSIASVTAEENENVSPGQPIALLTSGSQLEVEVAIPEILIAQVREGDTVSIAFDALQGKQFSGTVTEVGVAAMGMATTFPVTVRQEQADPACRPGMAAEVTFRFGAKDGRERIWVPPVAVGEDRDGRFVFVVEHTDAGFGRTHRRAVSVGDLAEEGIEILDGLRDGEQVVIAGVSRIRNGQRVRLLTSN